MRAAVERGGRELLVEVEINPGRANRARINRSPVPRAREVLGLLRTVLFAPEDLALVRGDPPSAGGSSTTCSSRARRGWPASGRTTSGCSSSATPCSRRRSWRAAPAGATCAPWTCGTPTSPGRARSCWPRGSPSSTTCRPHVAKAYAEVSAGQGETGLAYRSSLGDALPATQDREVLEAALLAALARVRPQEVERGVVLVGPHRDDLVLSLGDLPVKGYASHGESWSVALALRLATLPAAAVRAAEGTASRCSSSTTSSPSSTPGAAPGSPSSSAAAEQVLVTAAVPDDVPEALLGGRYDVHGGDGDACPLTRPSPPRRAGPTSPGPRWRRPRRAHRRAA